ncbi:MAG: DUF2383 domain-containing protein [Verrucomicrobiales bacterium]|nr:DUF2383 domain-containing protein [Verrucomicrobiales bacterium]
MNTTPLPNTPVDKREHCVSVCNSLLRGEISAVETYGMVIEKFSEEPEVGILERIRSEHEQAAFQLRNRLIEMQALPETSSGAWGAIVKTVQGTANLFGEESAVKSLQQGEEIGRGAYENALEDVNVLPECKNLIRGRLLPMVTNHTDRLESIGKVIGQ